MTRRRDDGAVTVAMTIAVVLAGLLLYGVARVGVASVLRARAENAADAAALAAADRLALGATAADARAAAATVARANGATLLECSCGGTSAEVVVQLAGDAPVPWLPAVQARARAEVDLAGFTGR
jgi:secretion/DNA translocation related TadE-like protein